MLIVPPEAGVSFPKKRLGLKTLIGCRRYHPEA